MFILFPNNTSRGLFARGTASLYSFLTYLKGTSPGVQLFIWFPNLPPWNCGRGVQLVYTVSKPTSRELWDGVQLVYMVSKLISRSKMQPILTIFEPSPRSVYTVSEPT